MINDIHGPQTHPDDDLVLTVSSAEELGRLDPDHYKGGVWAQAMPEEVFTFFAQASANELTRIADIFRSGVPIDRQSGETLFNDQQKTCLPSSARDFIDHISAAFNNVSRGNVLFGMKFNMGVHAVYQPFHFDTQSFFEEPSQRGIISVSTDPDDRAFETEWLATNGLTQSDVDQVHWSTALAESLPALFRERVQNASSGDFLYMQGLALGRSNTLRHGFLHRTSPRKWHYDAQGKARISLLWDTQTTPVIS